MQKEEEGVLLHLPLAHPQSVSLHLAAEPQVSILSQQYSSYDECPDHPVRFPCVHLRQKQDLLQSAEDTLNWTWHGSTQESSSRSPLLTAFIAPEDSHSTHYPQPCKMHLI